MVNPVTADKEILKQQSALAELITGMYFERHPDLEIKDVKQVSVKYFQDTFYHLSNLAESIRWESPKIFVNYIEWAQAMLYARNRPTQHLVNNLTYIGDACRELLPSEDYEIIKGYLGKGVEQLKNVKPFPETHLVESNPLLEQAKQYLSMLLNGKRKDAQVLVHSLVNDKTAVADIYLHIFQATLYEIGLLWQTNKITVAHEHYSTAATQLIMATLYPYIFDSEKKGANMMAYTVSGDLHEIGIRMICDFFEMDGWDTYYMGAGNADIDVTAALKEQQTDVLAISVTIPFYLSKAEELVGKIRNDLALNKLKIIVGGYPFSLEPELWRRIGADGSALNAKEAIALANLMISENNPLLNG